VRNLFLKIRAILRPECALKLIFEEDINDVFLRVNVRLGVTSNSYRIYNFEQYSHEAVLNMLTKALPKEMLRGY
jgi:hypothetical protein